MKKLNYLLLGAAGLLLASCSNEEIAAPAPAGEGNVNVVISLPGDLGTRSFGTGLPSEVLNYAVYDASDDDFIMGGTTTFGQSLSTTVSFNLANGKQYNIAFFAQSAASQTEGVYTFDGKKQTMTVAYEKMTSENNLADAYDCYYNVIKTGVVGTASQTISAILTRPVAQVNWGTDDIVDEAAAIQDAFGTQGQYIMTYLTTTPYTVLNLLTGAVSGNDTEVTLQAMAAPYTDEFPLDELANSAEGDDEDAPATPTAPKYVYVAMQYLLAPQASTIYNLDLSITDEGNKAVDNITTDVTVANAPVQANYRTNIYGNLLSSNVTVNVTKDNNWTKPDYDLPMADMVVPGLYYDSEANVYTIMSPAGLESYAGMVNGNTSANGAMVLLGADLDMTNVTHTPFNNAGHVFDGQNHTISNLKVTASNGNSAGFMTSAGTVSNLNFENASITGNYKAGVLAGDGLCAVINNVNVYNSSVIVTPWKSGSQYKDANNVGAIVGYLSGEPNASVTNCTVSGCTVKAYRKVGGAIGFVNVPYSTSVVTITGNKVENTDVYAIQTVQGYETSITADNTYIGQVYGGYQILASGTFNQDNNTATNVTTTTLTNNEEGNIAVSSPQQFLALDVAATSELAGRTITLEQNLNFEGITFDPVNIWTNENPCTFDGGGNTISNITLTEGGTSGLFGTCAMNISNLNVDGITGELGSAYADRFAGVISNLYGNLTEVHVSNVNIVSGEARVAAIVGIHNGGNMTNCSVNQAYLEGTWCVGGLSGGVNESSTMTYTGCTLTNVKINCIDQDYYGLVTAYNAIPNFTMTGCTMSGCTVNGQEDSQIALYYTSQPFIWNGQTVEKGNPDWTTLTAE